MKTTSLTIPLPERADAPATTIYVEIITVTDPVVKLGETRNVMILVPGGPGGNHTVYDEFREELVQHADLILFDPRGCGQSDKAKAEHCTIYHYIKDIEAIRQHFGLNKIILMGGSYGAMAVVGYATQYSDKLEKLIVNAGAPSGSFIETAKQNLAQRGTLEQIVAGEKLFSGSFHNSQEFEDFYKVMAPLYVYNYQPTDPVPTTKSKVPYNVEVTNLGFSDFLRKFNFEPELCKITCETLILAGVNDWINDCQYGKLMAEKIPNSKFVLFEKCGHFIWCDQKEGFLQALREFLLPVPQFVPKLISN